MGDYIDAEDTLWRMAIGGSLALHIVVIAVLREAEWPQEPIVLPEVRSVLWIEDWPPVTEPEPIVEEEFIEPLIEEDSGPVTEPVEPETPITESATEPSEAEPASRGRSFTPIQRSTDWVEDMQRTIVRLREEREEAESYVTFGFPFESIQGLNSRRDDNLVEVARRYGDGVVPERSSSGDQVIYDDDGCYQIVGTGSILLEDANRFSTLVPMGGRRCPQPAESRSDLFEDQTPAYLR